MKIIKYIFLAIVVVVFISTNAAPRFYFKKEYLLSLIEKFRLGKFEEKSDFSDRLSGEKEKGGVIGGIIFCQYYYYRGLASEERRFDITYQLMRLQDEMFKNFD